MIAWIKSNRFLSIVLLVCLCFGVYYIINAIRWIAYPNSIDYGEGFVMNYTKLWANGTWKWNINIPPYLTMVYGVGFATLAVPFVNLFGATLVVGRSLSVVSAIISCLLLYLIVIKITGRKSLALIAFLLPATQPIFQTWSAMARVDMVAVMFDLLGVYLFIRYKDTKGIYLAVIPFVCAVMIKLTSISGFIAVIIYLFIYNRGRVQLFAEYFIADLIVLMLPLVIVSNGEYLRHILLYQNTIQNISVPQFMSLFPGFLYPFVALLVLALVYVKRIWHKKEYTVMSIYFICSFVVGAIGTFRPGAASLYYMETIMSGVICAVLGLCYVIVYIRHKLIKVNAISISCLIVAILTIIVPLRYTSFPDASFTNSINKIETIMESSDKPIITENSAIALNLNKDLYIEYFIFTNMARLGYWDETEYVEKYNNQEFDYLLLLTPLKYRINESGKGIPDGHFTDKSLVSMGNNYSLIAMNLSLNWQYSMFLYEANNKIKIDNRQVLKEVYPVWVKNGCDWKEY